MKWTEEIMAKVYAQVAEKVAADREFAKLLLADQKKAVEELTGYALPDGYEFHLTEENGSYHADGLYTYKKAEDGELNDAELESVAGGAQVRSSSTIRIFPPRYYM
jgi:hypothetical protein